MPLYRITAKRETLYEFDIETDTEAQALAEMQRIDDVQNSDEYAYEYSTLTVTDIEVEEMVD
jgi:hypothetical protein